MQIILNDRWWFIYLNYCHHQMKKYAISKQRENPWHRIIEKEPKGLLNLTPNLSIKLIKMLLFCSSDLEHYSSTTARCRVLSHCCKNAGLIKTVSRWLLFILPYSHTSVLDHPERLLHFSMWSTAINLEGWLQLSLEGIFPSSRGSSCGVKNFGTYLAS